VEQTVTVWGSEARVDIETCIYWWGAQRQQVRMVLPSLPDKADIAYGAPFYGVGWTEVAEGTAPRNSDEIAPHDQMCYREVQGWLHLRGQQGGITIITDHPAFHHDDAELAAVLLRTSPSCGDHRLFWENAGRQVFAFSLQLNDSDWRTGEVQRQAAFHLRPPAARLVQTGRGELPPAQSLLQVDGESVAISSLFSTGEAGGIYVRIWETAGARQEVRVSGPLAGAEAVVEDLAGEANGEAVVGQAGEWKVGLPAWGIRTVRFGQ
jgi:alpha-mannosidase